MDILLITEGTYPYQMGGVSVWCDQLIRGMSENRFHVVSITASGREKSIWKEPHNLMRTHNVPLWGPVPRKRKVDEIPVWFNSIHQSFVKALVQPGAILSNKPVGMRNLFVSSLNGLFKASSKTDISQALLSNGSMRRLIDAWNDANPNDPENGRPMGELSLSDALAATELIEHLLRPLFFQPPKTDISHVTMNGPSVLVGMAAKWLHGTPMVVTEHGVYLRERYLSYIHDPISHPVKVLILNFYRLIVCAAYQMSDLLAPHSLYNGRWQVENGAAKEKLRVMYNGIDPEEFPPTENRPDEPTVVFMGRIDPIKDVHSLIRGFALVREKIPNARLRIFGATPKGGESYRDSCVALIRELSLADCATLEGRVEHPIEAYHAGHVVALTSISEGFPYTLVESMSCAAATVSTNVGGVSEAVGDSGLIVSPGNHKEIANACIRLLEDDALRLELGAKARARVLDQFTLEKSLNAYRKVYHELLGREFIDGGPGPRSVDTVMLEGIEL